MVGVTLEVSQREYERKDANDNEFKDMIVTVHALGTAIVELERQRGAADLHRPRDERGELMSDEQTEPQYDPGSTAGVPEHALERLEKMKAAGFFTSDLSVNEFLLVKAAGFDPLGLVIGSSIYHVGYQKGSWTRNQEMQVLSPGDVRGARARDDADGGGGRPARRRRRRRRPARREPARVGR